MADQFWHLRGKRRPGNFATYTRQEEEWRRKQQEKAMAKPIVHVGVSVSTDGVIPGRDNIINISACVGESFLFNQNVLPAEGKYHESPFWAKHPEEFKNLQRDTRSL